ncbi:hypothetical protein CBW57_05815 [Yersinia intermedia]|uniref:Uncharacterized protein n=1 Tax=Yersinia intermedia TaxID=631 RepID=A0A209A6I2_YERIN|nr:hypothetical protein CBW57_05815 [Yersinia intermedia]
MCASTQATSQVRQPIHFLGSAIMNRFIVFSPSPSSFKLQVCWLHSLTRITYLSKLIGTHSLAAFLHLEIYWG